MRVLIDRDSYVKVDFTVGRSHTGYINSELIEAKRVEGQTVEEYLETCTDVSKMMLSSVILREGVIVKSCLNIEDLLDEVLI